MTLIIVDCLFYIIYNIFKIRSDISNDNEELFVKDISNEDINKLTDIKIKRISKYNRDKHNELMENILNDIKDKEYNINNIVIYTIKFFKNLMIKYGEKYCIKK